MIKCNKLSLMLMIFALIFCISTAAGTVGAADTGNNTTVISSNSNVDLTVANDNGTMFNTSSNTTYTFFGSSQAGGGGLNPLHISSNNSTSGGDVTFTNNTSGTFYLSDTGGQGNWDDGILMVAVNGTIPNDFSITITSSGYTFAPVANGVKPSLASLTYQAVALNETFTKEDFIYGPQTWKPCPTSNYPIYEYQDMSLNNTFYLLFIDLYAGIIGAGTPGYDTLINNGMLQVSYTINGLPEGSLLAFDAYAYKMYSNHAPGVLATNRVNTNVMNDSTSSGYYVTGTGKPPVANFSASDTKGTVPFEVTFTDQSSHATSWLWDFGDGTTSTLQNPAHTYNSTGTYTVTLTVTNKEGSDEKTMEIITSNDDIQAPKPKADLPGGLYSTNQIVNLTATDDHDPVPKIYYTLNGDDPTTSSTLYGGSIIITNTTTLKFIAVDASGNISPVNTLVYTIDKTVPVPSASLPGGTYNTGETVTLNAADNLDSNPKIYYTLDGSTPTTISTLYNGPISIYKVGTNTLKFIAVDEAGNVSPVYSATYNMEDIKAPLASAELPSGTYQTEQVVNLSATDEMDPSPKIYYTLDGTDPTTNSTLYTWPISIGNEGTNILKFIAVDAAGHTSNIVMRIYTLDKPSASGTWSGTTLDSNIWADSLAMDSLDDPHIAYSTVPHLKYAYKNGTGWHIETVDTSTYGASCISLALDSSNNPHIVYFDLTTYTLKYAYKDGTGWHISNLADNENILSVDIVLYQNEPRLLFYSKKEGKLKYMYYNSTWVTEDVAPVSTGGRWNSLALDSAGIPYISFYYDTGSSGYLCYAKRTVKGEWHISVVDDSADAGQWNSLALDSAGNPYISYRGSDGCLKYSYWNGTQWVIDSVSNLESLDSELVLDHLGNPYILYHDFITGYLKYAYKDGSWTCINADTVDGTSGFISLTLNSSGIPNVSYSTANARLKYAYLIPFTVSASISGGSYNVTQTVTLTSTSGTTIYYTTDGSDPRTSSTRVKYTGSISINRTTALRFAAVDSTNSWSSVYTETYVITDVTGPTVTASPAGGIYYSPQNVALNADEASEIYYTIDSSIPTKNSAKYSGTISIGTSKTLKYFAVDAAGNMSPVYTQLYTIYKKLTYSYTVKVPYKKGWYKYWYKVKVKQRYKSWYKYRGKWRYKWKYKWITKSKYKWKYGWIYKNVVKYSTKYVLT